MTIKSTLQAYLASENTFAGHWETVVDCMENIEKILAMIDFTKELPQNTTVNQTERLSSSVQKIQ